MNIVKPHYIFFKIMLIMTLFPVLAFSEAEENSGNKLAPQYELQTKYFFEHYSFYDDPTHGVAVALIYRDLKKLTLFTEAVYQHKFGFDESLISIGGAYKLTDKTTIQEILGFSTANGTFPEFYSDAEIVHALSKQIMLHLGYKLSIFEEVNVHVLSIGSTVYPNPNIYLHVKFFHVIADFSKTSSDKTNSVLVKMGAYPNKDNEVAFFYGRNTYSFLSVDKIGNIDSNTYGLIWNIDFSRNWGFLSSISYEKRARPVTGDQFRVDIGLRYML